MEKEVLTRTSIECGPCKATNASNAKFCEQCGSTLYEECYGCAKPVLLTQSFCGECGADLTSELQKREDRYKEWMTTALSLSKQYEFDRAIDLFGRVAEVTDFRFKQSAEDSKKAIKKIQQLRERFNNSVQQATERATLELEKGNHREAVKYLKSVPSNLLSEEFQQTLRQAASHVEKSSDLENELREALERKDWALSARQLHNLRELEPQEPKYEELERKIAAKLIATAKRSLDAGEYEDAVFDLDAVPEIAVTDDITELRNHAETIQWLTEQFEGEPYASPLLGRLAVQLAKKTPNDPKHKKIVQELSHQIKQASRPKRCHLPSWRASAKSWIGGKAGLLALPESFDLSDPSEFKSAPGRYNLALGLAVQGLGKGRISEDFLVKKKSLLSFSKKSTDLCWGLDIGSSAAKGVLVKAGEQRLEIIDTFFHEFEKPILRRTEDVSAREALLPAIKKFLESKQPEENPVWCNLPAIQTVNRFMRLPPVKDKEAVKLLTQEVNAGIPIPTEELMRVSWIHDKVREAHLGRPAMVCAARKNVVRERIDLIESCGLQLAGIQADTVALINFAAWEFADLWSNLDPKESSDYEQFASQSVVLIDSGSSATNIVIVSGESQWCGNLELAGEDLTLQIATAAKVNRSAAEDMKRNPASLPLPATQYSGVESKLDELRSRLSAVVNDALKHQNKFNPVECWCMGGAALTHQWLRRVMMRA